MSFVHEVLGFLQSELERLVTPQDSLCWIYLASAAVIAVALHSRRWPKPLSLRRALVSLFPRQIYRHPSAKLDFKFFLLNTFLYGFFVAPLLVSSLAVARATVWLLVEMFGVPDGPIASGVAAQLLATAGAAIAADLGFYVSHYLQHKVPFLWEFHKVHHSAEVLHPITGFRQHPVDSALDAILMGTMTGLVLGLSGFAFGTSTGLITVAGVNAILFVFNLAGLHLRHSHVWLSYGPRLERFLVSPALHQIHHSLATRHLDKNLGGMFSIWDRLMGTLYVPQAQEQLTFGLVGGEHRDYSSVTRLYLMPLQKSVRLCVGVCFPEWLATRVKTAVRALTRR
jgi:sterol desaturase/sphingolipid hydroxylase (fatty acid hydroxylase superfamily)